MKDINDGTVQWSYIIQLGVSKLRDNKPEKHSRSIGQYVLSVPYVVYTRSASPHHAASGPHSWRERGGTNNCTTSIAMLSKSIVS